MLRARGGDVTKLGDPNLDPTLPLVPFLTNPAAESDCFLEEETVF